MRVDSWYRSGELAPQPELARWRLDPEAMLRKLGKELRDGDWKPARWRQVPYPKKGARLRHYVMPTVRDQVAFMAHMVALGPILDSQVANFAYGNRWYRPIAWNRRSDCPRWEYRPYPVLTDKVYLSYARSHGLFRRVAHWTVARMTNAMPPADQRPDRPHQPEDYEVVGLPPWTREDWWKEETDPLRAFWAALDIELAYPSVRISRLVAAMEQALRRPIMPLGSFGVTEIPMDETSQSVVLFDGCPNSVLEALAIADVRVEIGYRLTRALGEVTLNSGGIPSDAWCPPHNHPLPKVARDRYEGIPTGLAISGILLNVAFLESDRLIAEYLDQTWGETRGGIVRFVDDMYVLSRSSGGLLSLIEAVHGAYSGTGQPSLATPNEDSNICISLKKIKPGAVQKVVREYLLMNGWYQCEKCEQPLPRPGKHAAIDLVDWWAMETNKEEPSHHHKALEQVAIDRGDIGPFVTTLVERLSDMGTDTLRQRFGDGARDHLSRLHELACFDIDDEQVRADTRRTFSANRLVRAWLPSTRQAGEQHRMLREIRETIGFVLDRTPWKFVLWRALVRGAARRPLEDSETGTNSDQEATKWLQNKLRRIACVENRHDSAAWLNAWPEVDEEDGHARDRTDRWRDLYLSFLRSAFWCALAQVIRELKRHAARAALGERDSWVPSPAFWTTRAVKEGDHARVADSLGRIDEWLEVLYPTECENDIAARPWELDEFVGAVLAVHSTVELAEAWRSTAGPGFSLRVPATPRLKEMPRAAELLSRTGRLQPSGTRKKLLLDYATLANVSLGHWSDELGDVLFPASQLSCISQAQDDARGTLAAGIALGCFDWIDSSLAERAIPSIHNNADGLECDVLLLHDYACARRVIGGQRAIRVAQPTIHRLLWGTPQENRPLREWPMAAWETPAVGLPSRIAAALFVAARNSATPNEWTPRHGPLAWTINDPGGVLAAGRCWQFFPNMEPESIEEHLCIERSKTWEIVPHATFYLPFVSEPPLGVDCDSYILYCDVLILLTMLDGNEQILDSLAQWGVSGAPFVDRWAWRSRIHLPLEAWKAIEKIVRWSDSPSFNLMEVEDCLIESLAGWSSNTVSLKDFLPERIDVGLSLKRDLEVVRTIRPADGINHFELPESLRMSEAALLDELVVRVGQVAAWPNNDEVMTGFPSVSSAAANTMIEQVSNTFLAPVQGGGDAVPHLVVLPELAIPQQEVQSLRDLVRKEQRGAVAGLYWRVLKPAFRAPKRINPARWILFVNEAELDVPILGDRGPPGMRWFRVRKPVPAHAEEGLAKALSKNSTQTTWGILRGQRWYRFVHPEWGDFTVAVCADLIDSAPWRSLRGELLHLFMVAFNKDVDLFHSLTWVRAYENYFNVVSVNHGLYGGSFLWTPRRTHGRELAIFRGRKLVLTADIPLPVKDLHSEQRVGASKAVDQAASEWQPKELMPTNEQSASERQPIESTAMKFKSPPPGFRRP